MRFRTFTLVLFYVVLVLLVVPVIVVGAAFGIRKGLMANHLSFMDGPLLFMLLPGRTRVITTPDFAWREK